MSASGGSNVEWEKMKKQKISVECSVLDIRFSFDVGRSMFDVRRSSFKTIPYGINVTCFLWLNYTQREAEGPSRRSHWMVVDSTIES